MALLVAGAFFGVHFLHLTADFPNYSPWGIDWAKYTDEGWYGDAAIRHYLRGHWYVYGDFNPAAALPVWPALEFVVFRFTGVSLAAARALTVVIFGLSLVASWLLLRCWRSSRSSLAPAAAVLLLAVSPFCFVFSRVAILEPLMILLMLLALLAASAAPAAVEQSSRLRRFAPSVALGLLLPLMVLTKTTAIFLFPAIAFLLWGSLGYRMRPFLRVALPAFGLGTFLWITYFALFVRPHYLEDFRYLFSANSYTGITADTAWSVLGETFRDGLWIGKIVYPLAFALALTTFLVFRRRVSPLIVSLALWALGYISFFAYHDNPAPRYYLVVAVPLTLLIPVALEQLLTRVPTNSQRRFFRWAAWGACAAGIGSIVIPDALQTLHYVQSPQYTFTRAAAEIRHIVTANRRHSQLVLSISGSELSLMTGLHSICDDFGTMDLSERVATYRPGWYIAWNDVEYDKMEALAPYFSLHRVAAFPAMDDPERNQLILYRLDPRHRRPARQRPARLLQAAAGQ